MLPIFTFDHVRRVAAKRKDITEPRLFPRVLLDQKNRYGVQLVADVNKTVALTNPTIAFRERFNKRAIWADFELPNDHKL